MMGAISSYVKTPLLLPSSPIISQKKNTQVMLLMMMFALASNKLMIGRFTNSVPVAGGGREGAELFSVTSSTKSDVDYLGRSTRGYLNGAGINGEATLQGPIEEVARIEAEEATWEYRIRSLQDILPVAYFVAAH